MIVVADTGPIHYLVLSGFIGTLHDLYGVVVLPEAVRDELSHPAAPDEVRAWTAALPSWVSVRTPGSGTGFERLGPGEREALRLALELRADPSPDFIGRGGVAQFVSHRLRKNYDAV